MTNKTDFSQDAIITRWQEKAMQLDPDHNIEEYFDRSWYELISLAGSQTKRFVEMTVADADECAKCGREFDWENSETRAYIPELQGYGGEDMPEEERLLFWLDIPCLSDMAICEDCKSKMLRRYHSLLYCARAAQRRTELQSELARKEAERIKQLVCQTTKGISLYEDCEDDGSSLCEYVLDQIDYSAIADFQEGSLKQAFQNKNLYFYLYDNRSIKWDHVFWVQVIDKFSGAGA